jgi:hypothetical protein
MTALAGLDPNEARTNREFFGRLVESAVGAHLVNGAAGGKTEVYYWREGTVEVDFVLRAPKALVAIEVKSGRPRDVRPGLAAFAGRFRPTRTLLVGEDGIPVEDFLARPVDPWLS